MWQMYGFHLICTELESRIKEIDQELLIVNEEVKKWTNYKVF